MLNLNDESIKSEGGSFDSTKIFGYSVVEKVNGKDTIVRTLDNALVVGFNQGVSANGSKFWDLQMKDQNGNENNIREYDVDMSRDGWQKKQASQLKRLKHILSKFVPEGTPLPQAQTFPELWTAIENLLKQYQCNTKPMRLKLVYNDKGYLAVPAYVPFLEPMTVAAEQSKLSLNPNFDVLERPSKEDPEDAFSTPETADAGIPFDFGS